MYDNSSRVIEVDINEILPNRFQPRIQFDEEEILELSDSIKEHGVIQPLVVRTIGDKYEIIAGERRYKASVLAGKETVPVIVKNLNDKDSAEIALIENVQRKNLTPIEEALSYKKILDMGYITQENLAAKLGKSQPSVANKIRLLNLSDEVQEALLENKISERHARSLLKLSTFELQNEMLERIISERLTVRKTDEEIIKLKENKKEEKEELNMNSDINLVTNNMPPVQPAVGVPLTQEVPVMPPVQPTVEVASQPTVSGFDIFGTPTQTQPSSNFDIFASAPTQEVPVMPTIQPMVEVAPTPEVPAMTPIQPMVEVASTPEVPVMPTIQPMVEVASTPEVPVMPTIQPMVEVASTPEVPVMPTIQPMVEVAPTPEVPVMPTIQPMMEVAPTPEVQTFNGFQFDANGNVIAAPQPETNVEVPVTSPIIETPIENNQMNQQNENLFSFGQSVSEPVIESNSVNTQSLPEVKIPEPIIVADYSKQYDPVMPYTQEDIAPVVDFKEVINAIRECSNKIEQYGFKIDVEEYDLANLYQVVFKIEK